MRVTRLLQSTTVPFAFLLLLAWCQQPTEAQNYHQSYGSSRVVKQNQIGLTGAPVGSGHDASYISPGCISDSAKGIVRSGTYTPNPLLPQVNLGRTVKTAGDNMYQGGNPWLKENPYIVQQRQKILMHNRRVRQQMAREKHRKQHGEVYYPGQNAKSSGSGYSYSSGGAATYAESDSYKPPPRSSSYSY